MNALRIRRLFLVEQSFFLFFISMFLICFPLIANEAFDKYLWTYWLKHGLCNKRLSLPNNCMLIYCQWKSFKVPVLNWPVRRKHSISVKHLKIINELFVKLPATRTEFCHNKARITFQWRGFSYCLKMSFILSVLEKIAGSPWMWDGI